MITLIFDYDGTLVNSLPLVVECANKLSKKYGHKRVVLTNRLREKELAEFIRKDLKLTILQLPKYVMEMKKLMNINIKKVNFVDAIIPVLKKLSHSNRIMILSSNSKENIKPLLKRSKINISEIYSDTSIFGKRYMINKLINKENLEKNEVIYFGDETRDIEACKKLGITIVAVTWGFNDKKLLEIHNPDFLIDKPSQIEPVINKIKKNI